jgi:target of rapamycin complex 2 subunit AVO2
MLSSRNGTLPLLPLLLTSHPPASPTAHDKDGNTALHYASASGELKALRLLLQYGASPLAQNAYSWTPIAYSATAAAEAYFKQLVAEFERRRVEAVQQQREMEMQRMAGVRLVTNFGGAGGGSGDEAVSSIGPGARSASALGFGGENVPAGTGGAPQIGLDWSPITPMERMAMTPTEGMGAWPLTGGNNRRRAESGE